MRSRMMLVLWLAGALLAACSGVEMVPAPESTPAATLSAAQPAQPTQPAVRETDMPIAPFDETPNPDSEKPLVIGGTKTAGQPLPSIQPQPGDDKLTQANAFVDEAKLVKLDSGQYALHVRGNTPTPCHQLRAKVADPDKNNKIVVSVYTVVNPEMICTQVLRVFEVSVPLGDHPQGTYSVEVNGRDAGSFTMP